MVRKTFVAFLFVLLLLSGSGYGATASEAQWCRLAIAAQRAESAQQALSLLYQALDIAAKLGTGNPLYNQTLRMIVQTHCAMGHFDVAKPMLLQELAMLEKLGTDYPDLDFDFFYLGLIKQKEGKYKDAVQYFNQARVNGSIDIRLDSVDTPSTIMSACHHAAILFYWGKSPDADALVKNAVRSLWATWKAHPDQSMKVIDECFYRDLSLEKNHFSVLEEGKKQTREALQYYAIEEMQRAGMKRDDHYFSMLREVASAEIERGEYKAMEAFITRGVESNKKESPPDPIARARVKIMCGRLLVPSPFGDSHANTMDRARYYLDSALDDLKNRSGKNVSDLKAEAIIELSGCCVLRGESEKGIAMLDAALKEKSISKDTINKLHERLGIVLEWCGCQKKDAHQLELATKIIERSVRELSYLKTGSYFRLEWRLTRLYLEQGQKKKCVPVMLELKKNVQPGQMFFETIDVGKTIREELKQFGIGEARTQ